MVVGKLKARREKNRWEQREECVVASREPEWWNREESRVGKREEAGWWKSWL